jgi:transcriptional regulator with XRE-family HTH domain
VKDFGSPEIGAIIRQMREAGGLRADAVARLVPCSPAQLSRVESGQRKLTPSVADRLDEIYGSGGAISILCAAGSGFSRRPEGPGAGPERDIIVIRLPQGRITVPISRRDLLTALGIGTLNGPLIATLSRSLGAISPTAETLAELRRTYDGFLVASRFSTSEELKDSVVGQIAVIDALRQRAPTRGLARDLTMLMARHAEAVSWLYEESFDARSSLYWLDRASFWAQMIDWRDMVAFVFYRRSLLALNYAGDGRQTVDLARHALAIPDTLPHVRGPLATRLSQGYALLGRRDASMRAIDEAIDSLSLSTEDHPDNPVLDQQSALTDNLVAMRKSASLVLLGMTDPIAILEPRLNSIGEGHRRNYNVNRARLALAYANGGSAERACSIAADTLDGLRKVPSLSAWRELHRTAVVLDRRWPDRSDVRDVRALVDASGPDARA